MLVVVDVNVILSSLLSKGNSFDVFALNYLFRKFDFIAPDNISVPIIETIDSIKLEIIFF